MTEPVAYLNNYKDESTNITRFKPIDNTSLVSSKKLYTAEQLHPRMKMTKKQYEEWQLVIRSIYPINLYELFNLIFNAAEHHGEYAGMRDIFSFDEGQKKLAQLWSDFDQDNPEETIEIVPDKRWFVRSKTSDEKYGYWYLRKTEHYFFHEYIKELSTQFDTKEEAEKWKNPLTEVVQLSVEGE